MKLIETEFDMLFRRLGLHNAPAIQRQEMRRAFFAGASAMYTVFMESTLKKGNDERQIMDLLIKVQDELWEFTERLRRGEA